MRNLLLLATLLFVFSNANSAKWIKIQSDKQAPADIQLVSSDIDKTRLHFSIPGYQLNKVQTPNGEAFIVDIEEGSSLLIQGAPDLAKLTASVLIPDMAEMELKVISSKYKDYTNIEVAPSKGNFTRDIDPASVPYQYGKAYQKDAYFPGKIADLREPHIIRDFRGQTVVVYPFQYNPVTKSLRVYYDITVEVKAMNSNGGNRLNRNTQLSSINHEFNSIYSNHFINYDSYLGQSKYTPLNDIGNMLVISYGAFMPAMQRFVDWKNTIGMPTEMVDVATIGGSSAIKSYVANYYNTNGLTFLLLVGDNVQVPASSTTAGDSDSDYGYIVGNDHYIDIFVGRFSAETLLHVITQVDRTLTYERNPPVSTNWFGKSIGLGSSQGPGDDNEMDYEHLRNMHLDLKSYTYTDCDEKFDGSQGGLDASGDPTPTMVGNAVDAGRGLILYTGHGSDNAFSSSGYSSSDVNTLTNVNMLPFIWSVACVNGNFVNNSCFAEAWMRAVYNEQPTGAIATMMSTINQSWDPPMDAQDEMVDIMVESYTNNIKRSFGGISFNGCFHMLDEYAGQGESMADTWILFGDPSVMVRTDMPGNMTVSHLPTVFIGANQFQVNCNVDDALVALTINKQIIGTGYISGGAVNISFPPLTTMDTMTVAVTAFNYIPYIAEVPVIAASGPFVTFSSYQVNDAAGNNNNTPDFDENIMLDVSLENLGVDIAYSVEATISSTDPFINITDDKQAWGDIANGFTKIETDAFALEITDDIPDQHLVNIRIDIADNNSNTWNSTFNMKVNAPEMAVGSMVIDDVNGGNGDGVIDPGETIEVTLECLNNGHCEAPNTEGVLTSSSGYVNIVNSTINLGSIQNANKKDATYSIIIDAGTPVGTPLDFDFDLNSGKYAAQTDFNLKVGLIAEDFETGDFLKFPWTTLGNKPWFSSTNNPYEGTYCAESGSISGNQLSIMMITMDVVVDDSISFFRKVSSEQDYDFLSFSIDNQVKEEWSGEMPWERVSYPVTAGMHSFKWAYEKDFWASQGDDCGWIDYVIFPPVSISTSTDDITADKQTEFYIYPNPFNNNLNIDYTLEQSSDIRISFFNALGQEVIVLKDEVNLAAGKHSVSIDGISLEPGMYFCKFETQNQTSIRKIILSR